MFEHLRTRFYDDFGFAPVFEPSPLLARLRPEGWLRAASSVTDAGPSYKVTMELPGIGKDHVDIRVRGPYVEVKTEQADSPEKPETEYLRRERTYLGFYRDFELPESVTRSPAEAKLEEGVLSLELPQQHPAPTKVKVPVA